MVSSVKLSHLKPANSDYGFNLQSTNFTKIEQIRKKSDAAVAMGVTVAEDKGVLKLLLKDGRIVTIDEHLWQPFDELICTEGIPIKLELSEEKVMHIEMDMDDIGADDE